MKVNTNDWHKAFHDRELVEAQALTAEERGCFYTIRNLIFRDLGHVSSDDSFLANWCGLSVKRFKAVKAKLLSVGAFYLDGTSLRSKTADSIIADRMLKRKKAQKSGKAGGEAKAARERTNGHGAQKRARSRAATSDTDVEPQLFEEPSQSPAAHAGTGGDPGRIPEESRPKNPRNPQSTGRGKKGQAIDSERSGASERHHFASDLLGESENQESQKEEEEEEDSEVSGDDFTASAVLEAFEAWNEIAGDGNDWPKAIDLTDKRERLLAKLLNKEGSGGLTGWRAMLQRANASDFLAGRAPRGRGHENWRASLDYFARWEVFVEVMEGRHDNRRSGDDRSSRRAGGSKGAEAMGEALGRFLEDDPGGPPERRR